MSAAAATTARSKPRAARGSGRLPVVGLVGLAGLFVALPFVTVASTTSLVTSALAYVALTVAWAFFSGPTRALSLATAAFYGLGAYASAFAIGLPWPLPVLVGALLSAVLALVVGALALRVRGPYFAIFTFGLAELAKHLVTWYETSVEGTVGRIVAGPESPYTSYYTVLAVAAAALVAGALLRSSRYGAALVGIGADEERAQTIGIDTARVKLSVFALSAALMGAAGAAMAPKLSYIEPQMVFSPLVSFQVVIMSFLGGTTGLAGPVVGALFLSIASEILLERFRYYYMLALGVTLIFVVLVLPGGLAGLWRRGRPQR